MKNLSKSRIAIIKSAALIITVAMLFCSCGCSNDTETKTEIKTTLSTAKTSMTSKSTATSTQTASSGDSEETDGQKDSGETKQANAPAKSQSNSDSKTNKQTNLYLDKFESVPKSGKITAGKVSVGLNILVNNHHEYDRTQSTDFIEFYDLDDRPYALMFDDLDGDRFTLYEFNLMTQDFDNEYPDEYLGVCSGYRTYEAQKRNFDNSVERQGLEETLKWYTRPGFSEHHTGYAIDFNTDSYGDTAFTGEGNQAWFKKNCHKYGFILRYTADKKPITEINPEAWHFRQVGIPHADYIMKNGLCYEEYIDLLKSHTASNPLVVSPSAGGKYYIFYQKGGNGATVDLSGYSKYYCSGNNVDGFIITAVK